ncbi:MAG TPA: SRPBCC family protein [Acidimicrobiales bacterium]
MARPSQRAGRGLARTMAWFSVALGVPQVVAPGRVARFVGVADTKGTRALVRAVGVRELTGALGLAGRSRPPAWMGARVAGDAMDLAALGLALRDGGNDRGRLRAATAAVAGVTVLDVVGARRRARASGRSAGDGALQGWAAVTVNRSPEEAYRFWRDLERLPSFMDHLRSVTVDGDGRSHWVANAPAGRTVEWDAELVEDRPGEVIAWRSVGRSRVQTTGSVRFAPAPGGRGTEVTVEITYSPPAGALGAAVAKLFGEEPLQQVKDDLRRFKQVLETGEVVRSDGSPDGSRSLRQVHQRPAQPVGGSGR